MQFKLVQQGANVDMTLARTVQLVASNWDDYSFKTQFAMYFVVQRECISLGALKIGYREQVAGWTRDVLPPTFSGLEAGFFSVGLDVDYYKRIASLPESMGQEILIGLRDVAYSEECMRDAHKESVYVTSLLRGVSESVVVTQYRRVIRGEAVLTDYNFVYRDPGGEERSSVELTFQVAADAMPSTNVHVLIGRNGIGKTTILNGMVAAVHPALAEERAGLFYSHSPVLGYAPMKDGFFSGVVSVSFSVFDPFIPPPDNVEPSRGPKYAYLGMKKHRRGGVSGHELKGEPDLIDEFLEAFRSCMAQESKKIRWLRAITRLESDSNFQSMSLRDLATAFAISEPEAMELAKRKVGKMSSGHKIVLLTITALVSLVEEKTLVLLDEPESHLHPPLLSAFTRALCELLQDRNGVAIVATHSPVVVQEVPKRCVWKIMRSGLEWRKDRPVRETFAENVGVLTQEVFGLEVSKSGFHALLQQEVDRGYTFDQVQGEFGGRLGMEGLSLLMAMIAARDAGAKGVEP